MSSTKAQRINNSQTQLQMIDPEKQQELLNKIKAELHALITNHNLDHLIQEYGVSNDEMIKIQCTISIENNNNAVPAQARASGTSNLSAGDCCRCYKNIGGILYFMCCSESPCS